MKGFSKTTWLKVMKPRLDSRLPDDIIWGFLPGSISPEFSCPDSVRAVGISCPVFVISMIGMHGEREFRPWGIAAKYVSAGKGRVFKLN